MSYLTSSGNAGRDWSDKPISLGHAINLMLGFWGFLVCVVLSPLIPAAWLPLPDSYSSGSLSDALGCGGLVRFVVCAIPAVPFVLFRRKRGIFWGAAVGLATTAACLLAFVIVTSLFSSPSETFIGVSGGAAPST